MHEEVVREEIERRKVEISADARRRADPPRAQGEADAILVKYEAEAEGMRKLLEMQGGGIRNLVSSCQWRRTFRGHLLLIEKLEESSPGKSKRSAI